MEIIVSDERKRVELWLTRTEKEDIALRESLKPIYTKYNKVKYLVSVFESGNQDLYTNTRDLLLTNRRKHANI